MPLCLVVNSSALCSGNVRNVLAVPEGFLLNFPNGDVCTDRVGADRLRLQRLRR